MMVQRIFGNTIRQFRVGRGMSQEQLALSIGMDRTYYASVESGKRNISIQNIAKIAKGLDVDISDIFLKMEQRRDNSDV